MTNMLGNGCFYGDHGVHNMYWIAASTMKLRLQNILNHPLLQWNLIDLWPPRTKLITNPW